MACCTFHCFCACTSKRPLPSSESSIFSERLIFIAHLRLQSLNLLASFYFGYNAVSWSISAEFFFYAIFPFVFKRSFRYSFYLLIISSFSTLLLSFLLSFVDLEYFSSSNYDNFDLNGFLYINPLFRLPEFLFGIFIYRISFESLYLNSSSKISSIFLKYFINNDFLMSFAIILLFYFGFQRSFPLSTAILTLDFALMQFKSAIFFGFAIKLIASSTCFIAKFLSLRPFVFLGNISFAFYMLHQPIMIRMSQSGGIIFAGFDILEPSLISVLFASLLMSVLCFFLVEKPIKYIYTQRSLLS